VGYANVHMFADVQRNPPPPPSHARPHFLTGQLSLLTLTYAPAPHLLTLNLTLSPPHPPPETSSLLAGGAGRGLPTLPDSTLTVLISKYLTRTKIANIA
jgi:hypothetical protein